MDETINLNMEVDLDVGGKEWKGNIRDVVKISEAKLSDEFATQPSVYAWFATLSAMSSAETEGKKFNVSVLKAKTEKRIRAEFAARGEKTTENAIAAAVQTDEVLIAVNLDLIESERQDAILRALVRALDQRKDCLIQLGFTKRQELQMSEFGIDMEKVRLGRAKPGQ